jgi:hypothetical protein
LVSYLIKNDHFLQILDFNHNFSKRQLKIRILTLFRIAFLYRKITFDFGNLYIYIGAKEVFWEN